MISRHEVNDAYRRSFEEQIPYSTDPEYLRRMAKTHQYSPAFLIGLPIAGAILFTLAFFAVGAI